MTTSISNSSKNKDRTANGILSDDIMSGKILFEREPDRNRNRSRKRTMMKCLRLSSSSGGLSLCNVRNKLVWTLALVLSLVTYLTDGVSAHLFSNQFAVHVPAGSDRASEIASKHGFNNLGQIGSLSNFYLFEHGRIRKRSVDPSHEHHQLLTDESDVHWFDQQIEKIRVKRDFSYFEGASAGTSGPYFASPHHSYVPSYQNGFGDPLFKEQWYLTSGSKDGFDMNVQSAWKRGYTGKGIVVSILDDGIQTNHPDLVQNYDPRASTDINDNDNDPTPQDNGDNKHGTRCAGEVAATAGNNICGVGVAYNASIGGVRMLDGTVNDAVEAKALGLNPEHVDVYSASWGPEDDGKTVDGPGPLARRAFIYGVTNGRRGLGSIFIWASGNGGRHVDSCNCDGYTNSIFTLSISSATQGGFKPWYLEECASTLATTYSSGTPTLDKSVATVDMDGRLRPDHICTVEHTGTSASAPLAAGIAALALEANRNLSWRDLQHLVVMTSRSSPLEKEEGWYVNGVSRKFSHKFGYGLMDAGAMVDLAVNWAGVPPQHICKSREIREDREIPGAHLGKVKVFMDVDGCAGTNSEIRFLEHVQCKISLRFFPRGNLRILLTSPMGTTSVLLFERPRDVSSSNFDDWPFLSVHFWGEQAHGRWTLEIINSGSRRINQPGILKKWQLILYGTDVNPVRLRSRSYSGGPETFPLSQGQSQQQQPSQQQQQQTPFRPVPPPIGQQDTQAHLSGFVPQDYSIYPGASENVEQVQGKPHMVRSQCKNEYWIPDLTICVNGCPEGYYPDSDRKECLSCPQRCKSCYNGSSCTACEHNLVLFGTSCVPVCPQGYYEADSSCELCGLESCAACAGPVGSECVRCKPGLFLHENKCLPQCPGGFRPTDFRECTACPTGCHSCDENKCLVCSGGYQLSGDDESSCVQHEPACPVGLFLDAGTKTCAGCGSPDCVHCTGLDACVECEEGYYLFKGQCVANCWDGLYASFNKKECFHCPKLCTKCGNPDLCIKCREDGMLEEGKCLPHCSDGFYNDLGTCSRCSPGCLTCIGASSSDCVTCSPGLALTRGGSCVSKNNAFTTDYSNSSYSNDRQKTSCPQGFWLNQVNGCQPCHSTCSRCTGPMPYNCRSCVSPLRLDRGSSRCIECCESSDDLDCCHCDAKRHTQSVATPLTADSNGECHFVSRRVSESDERRLSSGKWSDSMVLSFFWLSVFFMVAILIVSVQRRRRRHHISPTSSDFEAFEKERSGGGGGGGRKTKMSTSHFKSNSTNMYVPVSLSEDSQDCDDLYINRSSCSSVKGGKGRSCKTSLLSSNSYSNNQFSDNSIHRFSRINGVGNGNGNGSRHPRDNYDDVDVDYEDFDDDDDERSEVAEGVPLVLKT